MIIFGILFTASVAQAGEYKVTNGTFTGSELIPMKSKKYIVIGAIQVAPTSSIKANKAVPVLYPQGHKVKVLSDQKKKIDY